MKIQELAIIFVIIILPISILLSEYTQFQIQTLKTQTAYDAKLTSATYDAIKAFQLNEKNETYSALGNAELRDLSSSVNSFRNSLMSTFKLNGYTEEELNNYIPALVYTLYDGFYIYSPYKNIVDEDGNIIEDEENQKGIYGLKPYVNYSCRYVYPKGVSSPTIDVVITYALDNHITVQGIVDGEYVNKSGYLIDNIDSTVTPVTYNGVPIETERLVEEIAGNYYQYVKYNGTKYYLDEANERIITISNGTIHTHATLVNNEDEYNEKKNLILYNNTAQQYYIKADAFTEWFKSTDLIKLTYEHAIDEVINKEDGTTSITNVWNGNNTKIFADDNNNIENESSNFNQHRLAVIRHKIETNLAIAISNYNSYSRVTNIFQMPELKEDEWDHITHNISLISFLQGLPIGGKIYNGYTLVTNSESEEVVLEENIYILGEDSSGKTEYHRIGDNGLMDGSITISAGSYETSDNINGKVISAGRLNLDFMRNSLISKDNTAYYYPLNKYNASYDSVVMQNNVTTYDDIYEYVNSQSNEDLKIAFYTALGRERMATYDNEIKTYTVVYSANGEGVTNLATTQIKTHGEPLELVMNDPTLPSGSTFKGWCTTKDGTGDYYSSGDTYTEDSSMILYAIWEEETYTITFNANEGSSTVAQINDLHYGDEITPLPTATRDEAWEFLGWVDPTTGQIYKDKYKVYRTLTLEAKWKLKEYTIEYYNIGDNGEVNILDTQTKEHGDDSFILEPRNVPERAEYNLIGWSTTEGGVVKYHTGGLYKDNADLKLYAVWEYKSYTITFNANGGELGECPESESITVGADYYIPTAEPTRDGYDFVGWNTNKNETTAQYKSTGNNKITPTGNMTLYAIWATSQYTVTYDPNGGSGAPSSQTKIHGQDLILSTEKPSRTGYVFQGWATSSSSTDVDYLAGGTYILNKDITLYAVWEAAQYSIIYDANGGTFNSGATTMGGTVAYGAKITSTKPSQTGYKFKGWAESSTATEIKYESGDNYYGTTDTTLYAVWEAVETCTITYDKNGGVWSPTSPGPKTEEVISGEKTKMSKHSLFYVTLAEGGSYKFIGWNTNQTAKEAEYSDGSYITITEDTTLYAIWKWVPDTYTVTYDANGGEGAPEQQTKTHGTSLTLSSTEPTRSGYIFLGWATTSTATAAEYEAGGTYTTNAKVTLYAVWKEPETYKITYDKNGGTWTLYTPTSQTVTEGESVNLSSYKAYKFTMSGFTPVRIDAIGWSEDPDATEAEYKFGQKITPTHSMKLYVVWP